MSLPTIRVTQYMFAITMVTVAPRANDSNSETDGKNTRLRAGTSHIGMKVMKIMSGNHSISRRDIPFSSAPKQFHTKLLV
jgi:hypothetical protein